MKLSDLPALGQPLDAGIFAGITTKADGTHCAVALLADKPAEHLDWDDAMAWAQGLQAELPTRPVAALLYANVGDQFEKAWHWTADTDKAYDGCAWGQYFDFGIQIDISKSYEGRARAVRLIPLIA